MPKSNGKQAPPLSFAVTPTVARDARPSHPSPYRKKSRFAKKKSAPPKKNTPAVFFSKSRIYRIYQIAASAKPAISDGGFAAWLTPFAGDEVNPRMAD